jgi:tetratricopeptide (TPR) repeat protein
MCRTFGRLAAVLLLAVAACGGGDGKKEQTTPKPGGGTTTTQSMNDGKDPAPGPNGPEFQDGQWGAGNPGGVNPNAGGGSGAEPAQPAEPADAVVTPPNFDPDPAQARTQVEAHLTIARQALSGSTPDGETALKEAKLALAIDAANVDAAAMVALAYYHKRLYDTAELVLDDTYKRETAKQNANINYTYGLVYDATNRPDQAQKAYAKAVQLDPNHASALINLGAHQLRNGQYTGAQQTFERLTNQFRRTDHVTLTSLGSAYRGRSSEYPPGSPDRDQLVRSAEQQYKRALQANAGYGPAYYNLGLLYLDNDPYPGLTDPMARVTAAKQQFEQYKSMKGFDIKLYDDRMKDAAKVQKRIEKQLKAKAKANKT